MVFSLAAEYYLWLQFCFQRRYRLFDIAAARTNSHRGRGNHHRTTSVITIPASAYDDRRFIAATFRRNTILSRNDRDITADIYRDDD